MSAAEQVYLQPGQIWFGDAPTCVRTVLGSCVAITLWHPLRRVGGMCHYMLPGRHGRGPELDARYADDAAELLLRAIEQRGLDARDFEAKLFGGGRMFAGWAEGDGKAVQERNVEVARRLVSSCGWQLRGEHLGGHGHRHLLFDVDSGNAWLRHTPLIGPSVRLHASGEGMRR